MTDNKSPTPTEARYLIVKGGAYYRPNAEGYTRSKTEAGRYTLDEAISHSHPNGPSGPRDGIDYVLDDAATIKLDLKAPDDLSHVHRLAARLGGRFVLNTPIRALTGNGGQFDPEARG
ncbi:MAG TPA: hypothetical protein VF463_19910 [Sphingobium sp.]